MKNKKIIAFLIIFVLVLASFFVYKSISNGDLFLSIISPHLSKIKSNDIAVADVNGEKILLSDVALSYFSSKVTFEMQKEEIEREFGEAGANELAKDEPDPIKSLNAIIDNKLLVQYAKSKGYKPDTAYLKNLLDEQKKWFYYEIDGISSDINFDPLSKRIFDEVSKLVKDMVNESGLSKEEFFEKKYIPNLEDAAILHSMFEELNKNITVSPPMEEEIKAYYSSHYRGTISFAKLVYNSYDEALEENPS